MKNTPATNPPELPTPDGDDQPRDLGRCSGCGYDLSGHAAGLCPECALPIVVHVETMRAGARLRARAAWAVALAGAAFLASAGLEWRLGGPGLGWWNPLAGFALTGLGGLVLLGAWARFKLAAASGAPFAWVLMVLAPMLWAAVAVVYVPALALGLLARGW